MAKKVTRRADRAGEVGELSPELLAAIDRGVIESAGDRVKYSHMYFSSDFRFESDCLIIPDEAPIEVSIASPTPIKIKISKDAGKQDGKGKTTFVCTLYTEEAIPEELHGSFAAEWQKQPEQIHEITRTVNARISRYENHVTRIVQWFTGNDRHQKLAITRDRTKWSITGGEWTPTSKAPPGAVTILEVRSVSKPAPAFARKTLTNLLEHFEEPLAHEMAREARSLLSSSPRSCIMLAVAAAEYGFKAFAASVVPAAEWLLLRVQAPPLDTMLHHYFPSLPLKQVWEVPPFIPKGLRTRIQKAVQTRNDIAHAGAQPPDTKVVSEIARSVLDLLYILDAYSGYEWAWYHLSSECKAEIKNEIERIKSSQGDQGSGTQL